MTHKISGHTKAYAVLGHPIGHTLSPVMHNAAFRALGMDALYLAFNIAPADLLVVLDGMRRARMGGVNLTVPLKEVGFHGLERLAESARLVGSVNTVQFTPEGLVGHNTDGDGFIEACREAFGADCFAGCSLFVLGAGGAGRALAMVGARAGAASVVLADLDAVRAEKAAAEVRAASPGVGVRAVPLGEAAFEAARAADLVVQATPQGMKPDEAPALPPEAFRKGQSVFDLVYMFPETSTMRAAASAGARAANGLDMLLYQGVKAFEIWTGVRPPVDVMRAALKKEVYG